MSNDTNFVFSDKPVIVEKIEEANQNETTNPDQYLPRDQLKITLKIFLQDPDVEQLQAAVGAALTKLSTNRVDSLFVATPPELLPHIGIGSGAAGPEQEEARQQLLGEIAIIFNVPSIAQTIIINNNELISGLWRGVEQLITDGKVGSAGLSDLHPPVFISIYQEANVKPSQVQVNLKSCCVMPEELSVFAKENGVTLVTHSDPSELLPGDSLRSA